MKYMGSKNRIAKEILPIMLKELEQTILKVVVQQIAQRKQRWPKVGEKLIAAKNEIKHHWFKNVIENARKLTIGETYTVKKCDPRKFLVSCRD